jgi:asparagine synthase (glutamine-hydrolysing)
LVSSTANAEIEPTVAAMNAALAHRGPDGEGCFVEGLLGLGHRRLAVIDPSPGGQQPMHSSCGRYAVSYNGELYNYRELRRVLADAAPEHPFRTQSDTEVLLAAFRHWGEACLDRLQGMFAFALWDKRERELWLVRDRLGVKPLYYAQQGDQLVFASELRALMASGLVERKLDRRATIDYLRYQRVHGRRTLVDGVRSLPPGAVLRWRDGHTRLRHYWTLPGAAPEPPPSQPREWHDRLREHLELAVERRLVADVPLGAFLSGGIDSSAVVALMSRVAGGRVNTFSVAFDDPNYDESRYARLVAERFGTEHHELMLTQERLLALLPEALEAQDHPSGDGPNSFVVSKLAKEANMTVALSGLGGDELFAGYPLFRQLAWVDSLRPLRLAPQFVRRRAGGALRRLRPGVASNKLAELLAGPIDLAHAYPLMRQSLLDDELDELWTDGRASNTANEVVALVEEQCGDAALEALPRRGRISALEIASYLGPVLLRDTDQMSMAHGLEVRVPLIDHQLVELALRAPNSLSRGRTPKAMLVGCLDNLLPRAVVERKKMGFVFPWARWMRAQLAPLCRERLASLGRRSWFDAAALDDLWQRFAAEDPTTSWSRIWALVALETWLSAQQMST